jgi:hypothetical protein
VAKSAALREPSRPLLFALAVLIHAGLFQLLVSPPPAQVEPPERRTVLVLLPDAQAKSPPREVAPLAPPRLLEASPSLSTAPQLIAPPTADEAGAPPSIDWRRDAEQAAREHALEAEAGRPKDGSEPTKPKQEFHWSHSRTHRVERMEDGGFVVWIGDKCGVAITVMAMPFCQFGRKPARGDLFEHMNDPPAPGDWKDPDN